MASVRGIFRVVSREHYHNGRHVLVKLESTQTTTEMFAARIEMMLTDRTVMEKFAMGAELAVEVFQAANGRKL